MKFDIGFGHIIVVPPYKFEKLEGVIRKIYCQIGLTIREDGFWMPVSHVTDKTLGYCFIEYNTPQVTNY